MNKGVHEPADKIKKYQNQFSAASFSGSAGLLFALDDFFFNRPLFLNASAIIH